MVKRATLSSKIPRFMAGTVQPPPFAPASHLATLSVRPSKIDSTPLPSSSHHQETALCWPSFRGYPRADARLLSLPRQHTTGSPFHSIVRSSDIQLQTEHDRLPSHASLETVNHISLEITELPHGLDAKLLPKHVAIIMDGNSRWAERRGMSRYEGHQAGATAAKEIVRLSCTWGIEALTMFAFSVENWNRSKVEVSFLMQLFQKVLQEELENLVKENIQVHIIGGTKQFPESLQSLISEVEQNTRQNSGLKLTVAIGYSGRYDIVQACQKIVENVQNGKIKPEDITESVVETELGTSWLGDVRDPDLMIRTSGERRLSNFLLWQLAYTELFFMDEFWPDFDENLYAEALLFYQRRNRRYGRRSDTSC